MQSGIEGRMGDDRLTRSLLRLALGRASDAKASGMSRPRQALGKPGDSPVSEAIRSNILWPRLTRRGFLVATAGTAAATVVDGGRHLDIRWRGRALVVRLDGREWIIDPALYGAAASVRWLQVGGDHWIRLAKGVISGTGLRADFVAQIRAEARGWRVRYVAKQWHFDASVDLAAWMKGRAALEGAIARPALRYGSLDIVAHGTAATLAVGPTSTYTFGGDFSAKLSGGQHVASSKIELRLGRVGKDTLLYDAGVAGGSPASFLSIAIESGQSCRLDLGRLGRHQSVTLDVASDMAVQGESAGGTDPGVALITLTGAGSICLRSTAEAGPPAPGAEEVRLSLEKAVLLLRDAASASDCTLAARVCRQPRAFDLACAQFRVVGSDEHPINLQFIGGRAAGSHFTVRLRELWVPVPGADRAVFSAPDVPFAIYYDDPEAPEAEAEARAETAAYAPDDDVIPAASPPQESGKPSVGATAPRHALIVGPRPERSYAIAVLDQFRFGLRRAVDLLNLEFSFLGIRLSVRNGRAQLESFVAPPSESEPSGACLIVHFPPQHLAEAAIESKGEPDPIPVPESKALSPALLSGPSRIAFDVLQGDPPKSKWSTDVTIDKLTDWANLAHSVNERARERDDSGVAALEAVGITPKMTWQDAMAAVAESIAPPRPWQTALELSTRLTFSPGPKARWRTPRGTPDPARAPLWHARLDPETSDSVRAIWSDELEAGTFKVRDRGTPAWGDPGPLGYVRNYWDIVAQSSIFGLPAIKAAPIPGKKYDERNPGDKVAEANYVLSRSRVMIPGDPAEGDFKQAGGVPFTYLGDIGAAQPWMMRWRSRGASPWFKFLSGPGDARDRVGVAVPLPFQSANIVLSAMGGSFVGEWYAEPAILAKPPSSRDGYTSGWPKQFNLERLAYWSQLGRDIRVEAVHAGYLFPLGHRASLVTLTERRFAQHPKRRHPVAYLIKRKFIVVQRPRKEYPAYAQKNRSRDFPADMVEITTRRTPDLADEGQLSNISTDDAFWPRVRGDNGASVPFEFKWTIDGDDSPAQGCLLFVSLAAVTKESVVASIVKEYNGLAKAQKLETRVAHAGARRRYVHSLVPASVTGTDGEVPETSFVTETWTLRAEGPDPAVSGTDFHMNGAMIGAGQPPFYPKIARASVHIQSLDRLIGRPHGPVAISFYDKFVSSGFNDNAAEIFAEVVQSPPVSLSSGGDTTATGGIAQPDGQLVALSRKIGLVTSAEPAPGKSDAGPEGHGQGDGDGSNPPGSSIEDLTKGKFDPSTFFKSDAKLLGIVKLSDIIAVASAAGATKAPRLIENAGLAPLANGIEQTIKRLKGLLEDIKQRLSAELKKHGKVAQAEVKSAAAAIDALVRDIKDKVQSAIPLQSSTRSLQVLYPDLDARLDDLVKAFASVVNLLAGLNEKDLAKITGLLQQLKTLAAAAKRLTAEIGEVLRNPVPKPLKGVAETVGKFREEIPRIFRGLTQELEKSVQNFVLGDGTPLRNLLTKESGSYSAARTLLFGDPTPIAIASFQDLADRARKAREGWPPPLLRRELIEPIENIVKLSKDLPAILKNAAAGKLDDLARDLADGIRKLIEAFSKPLTIALVAQVQTAANSICAGDSAPGPRIIHALGELLGAGRTPQVSAVQNAIRDFLSLLSEPIDLSGVRVAAKEELMNDARLARESISTFVSAVGAYAELAKKLGINASSCAALADQISSLPQLLKTGRDVASKAYSALLAVKVAVLSAADPSMYNIARRGDLTPDERQSMLSPLRDRVDRGVEALRQVAGVWLDSLGLKTRNEVEDRLKRFQPLNQALEAIADAIKIEGTATQLSEARKSVESASKSLEDWTKLVQPIASLPIPNRATAQEAADTVERAFNSLSADKFDVAALVFHPLTEAVARHLQGVAIPIDVVNDLTKQFASLAAAGLEPIKIVDSQLGAVLKELSEELEKPPKLASEIYPKLTEVIADLVKILSEEATRIEQLQKKSASLSAQQVGGYLGELRKFVEDPGKLAAIQALKSIIQTVSQIASADLSAIIREKVRSQIETLKGVLVDLAKDMLPTKLDLTYEFDTDLNDVKIGGNELIKFADADKANALAITTRISVDILTRKRSIDVKGSIKPFDLRLFGSFDLATISFSEIKFESKDGSSPKFNVKIKDVETGEQLKFLEPLKAWMSPGPNGGPYIRPLLGAEPGVVAGYVLPASTINVGALQFINIGINIATRLSFTSRGGPAVFIFGFSTIDSPFLIASPPYGGGGFITLEATPKGIRSFEMSLMFGAVVDLTFGPLRAHGRVTSGIYFRKFKSNDLEKEGYVIEAFVEAVGEGSIAIFSVCVHIRIGLSNSGGGALRGYSTYSYAFRLGIKTIKYAFRAERTIKGGKKSADASPGDVEFGGDGDGDGSGASKDLAFQNITPIKSVAWNRYRTHIDMSLLS
jgi:hypothetical protein